MWPALERGDWVLCGFRFTDAAFAYQGGGREMGFDRIQVLADWVHPAFAPDVTLLFDLPPTPLMDALSAVAASWTVLESEEWNWSTSNLRVRDAYLRRAAADQIASRCCRVTSRRRPCAPVCWPAQCSCWAARSNGAVFRLALATHLAAARERLSAASPRLADRRT